MPSIISKIKPLNEIISIVQKLKKQNKKIVTTNGVFDILHPGHVQYLEEAKNRGDLLVVGVNSDESVRQNKGSKRPINDEISRISVVAALESVDYLFIFNEKYPKAWLKKIKPHFHVKADDYQIDRVIEKNVVEENGGKIILIPISKGYSTTNLIKKIVNLYK